MGAISAISNILPVLTGVTSAVRAVSGVASAISNIGYDSGDAERKQQELALKQLKAQQGLQEQHLAQQTALERERIAAGAAQDEEARRAALRRAVARQRAQFGSSGMGNQSGGSGDAVLLGLFDESEEERERRENLDSIRGRALDLDIAQNRSLNLLQATQLAQRQGLGRLF